MKKIFIYIASNPKLAWSFAIFWTIGIFYGCSLPGKELPKLNLFDNFDKVVHITFFMGFAYLWYAVFYPNKKMIAVCIFLAFLFGTFIEVYQKYFVVGRSFDVWDIVADTIGAFAMLLIIPKNKIEI